jgi:GcrA cell cycle regulator
MGLMYGEWNDANVIKLKQLWADGFTCSQIANELQAGFSRNAIIGKVMRLKLERRGKTPVRTKQRPIDRPHLAPPPATSAGRIRNPTRLQAVVNGHDPGLAPPQRRNPSHNILAKIAIDAAEPGLSPILRGEKPDGTGIKFSELGPATCRWPRGDPAEPDFEFCGGKSLPDLPYCARHSRIAYQPPKVRVAADKWAMHRADTGS